MTESKNILILILIMGGIVLFSPAGAYALDCSGAVDLGCVSSVTVSGDTTGKTSSVTTYNCVTWPEDGPEDVYIIRPDGTGNIDAVLTMMTADLDVFILSACDETTCLAYGNTNASLPAAAPS